MDAHVGNFILEKCLKQYLCTKTRIVVTHLINHMPEFDYIYVMENGKIIESGTY